MGYNLCYELNEIYQQELRNKDTLVYMSDQIMVPPKDVEISLSGLSYLPELEPLLTSVSEGNKHKALYHLNRLYTLNCGREESWLPSSVKEYSLEIVHCVRSSEHPFTSKTTLPLSTSQHIANELIHNHRYSKGSYLNYRSELLRLIGIGFVLVSLHRDNTNNPSSIEIYTLDVSQILKELLETSISLTSITYSNCYPEFTSKTKDVLLTTYRQLLLNLCYVLDVTPEACLSASWMVPLIDPDSYVDSNLRCPDSVEILVANQLALLLYAGLTKLPKGILTKYPSSTLESIIYHGYSVYTAPKGYFYPSVNARNLKEFELLKFSLASNYSKEFQKDVAIAIDKAVTNNGHIMRLDP